MAAASKEKKGAGLTYGMVRFVGSRQAPGPSEAALAKLRLDGLLREEETEATDGAAMRGASTLSVAPTPETARRSTDELDGTSASASPEPAARTTSKPASPGAKAQRRASGAATREAATSRPSGRRIHRRSAYRLRRTAETDEPARSVHFRLPALIDRYINELAAEYECSRTHVVCALVTEARERRARGRRRGGGGDESPPAA